MMTMDIPERAAVLRLIKRTLPRAAEHLALAPETWEMEGRRGLWLWGLLNISAAADGSDLRIDHVCEGADAGAFEISGLGFSAALSPILAAEAPGCGLSPQALEGPTGIFLRQVLARAFHRYVDWDQLRRFVSSHLRLDWPLVPLRAAHVHEMPRDRRRGRHLGTHQVRTPARALPPLEVAV